MGCWSTSTPPPCLFHEWFCLRWFFFFPLKVNRGGLVHRFLREGWEKYQRWRNVAMSVSSAWYYELQFVIINNLKPSKSFQNGVPCNCPSFRFINISILLHSSIYIFIYVRSVCVCACVCAQVLSHVQLFATSWTVAHQAPLSMGFPSQKYWSRLPRDLPDSGIKPVSPASPALAGGFFPTEPPGKPMCTQVFYFLLNCLSVSCKHHKLSLPSTSHSM